MSTYDFKTEAQRHFAACDLPLAFLDHDPRLNPMRFPIPRLADNEIGFIDVQPGRWLPRITQHFRVYVQPETTFSVIDQQPETQHILALMRQENPQTGKTIKRHFILGHDERQLFVAGVTGVASVTEGLASLKPRALQWAERQGLKIVRQGDWFFVPRWRPHSPEPPGIAYHNEPLGGPSASRFMIRSRNPHVADEQRIVIDDAYRYVHGKWTVVGREIKMIMVRGRVRHAEHSTIDLQDWHQAFQSQSPFTGIVGYWD